MTAAERSNLVLAFARVLYVNGQATEQTVAAAEQLGRTLGLRAKVMPRWGELQLQSEDENDKLISQVAADLMQIAGDAQTSLELIGATIADGTSALISILAMSLGLITPKIVIDGLSERSTKVKS
jgi:hypothetical protein